MPNQRKFPFTNRALEYVTAVAEHGSLTKAARTLYVTQPSLSRFIHTMETRIGGKLFNRVGNQFLPTHLGERLVAFALQIRQVETHLGNEIVKLVDSGVGRIRVTLPSLRSAFVLPVIIPPFRKLYPGVEIHILEAHAGALEENLVAGKADFALINTPVKSPHVVSKLISRDQILLAVPADHPLAGAGKKMKGNPYPVVDIRMFAEDEFIMQYPDQRTRQVADTMFREAGIAPRIMLEIKSIETSLKLVSLGCGVCFAAEAYLEDKALRERMRFFSLNNPIAMTHLSLCYLENSYMPAHFLDFIRIVGLLSKNDG